jgi:hypothetical protein
MHKLTNTGKKTKRKRHPVQAAGSWKPRKKMASVTPSPVQATGSWKPRKKNGQRDAQPEGLWGWVSQAILENEKIRQRPQSRGVPRHASPGVTKQKDIAFDSILLWSGSTMDKPTTPITRCDQARAGKHSTIYHI